MCRVFLFYIYFMKLKLYQEFKDICPDCGGKGEYEVEGIAGQMIEQTCKSCGGTGEKKEFDRIHYIKQACEKYENQVKDTLKQLNIKHGFVGSDVEYFTEDPDSGVKLVEVKVEIYDCRIEKEALDKIFDLGYENTILQFRNYARGELTFFFSRPWMMFEESKYID